MCVLVQKLTNHFSQVDAETLTNEVCLTLCAEARVGRFVPWYEMVQFVPICIFCTIMVYFVSMVQNGTKWYISGKSCVIARCADDFACEEGAFFIFHLGTVSKRCLKIFSSQWPQQRPMMLLCGVMLAWALMVAAM